MLGVGTTVLAAAFAVTALVFSHRSARAVLLGIIRWGGRLSTGRDLEAAISAFESTLDRGLGSVWQRPLALLGPSLLIMADRLGRLGGALALPSSAGHQWRRGSGCYRVCHRDGRWCHVDGSWRGGDTGRDYCRHLSSTGNAARRGRGGLGPVPGGFPINTLGLELVAVLADVAAYWDIRSS